MSDQFVVKNDTTNEFVTVRRGKTGYWGNAIVTQEYADWVNRVSGHTPAEVDAAQACSMFGWGNFDALVRHKNPLYNTLAAIKSCRAAYAQYLWIGRGNLEADLAAVQALEYWDGYYCGLAEVLGYLGIDPLNKGKQT